ncbi:Glycerol-3-phosphate 2-O-acyltransferase 4 [Platanthera guangdongensis]|uniref:Glycerol-3-phosphate 2-O-acyltransferase 4 n=1 Tax=Platanthera guangdongensis TaxID=2320717 RepID=A0ABR2LFG3_9ASPA
MILLKVSFHSSPTTDSCSKVCLFLFAVVSGVSFPYFFLLAIEVDSLLHGAAHLLRPTIFVVYKFCSEEAGIQIMIYTAVAGIPISDIKLVAHAVLLRFYVADIRVDSYRIFHACRRRQVVVTTNPAVMVEPFVNEYLGGDQRQWSCMPQRLGKQRQTSKLNLRRNCDGAAIAINISKDDFSACSLSRVLFRALTCSAPLSSMPSRCPRRQSSPLDLSSVRYVLRHPSFLVDFFSSSPTNLPSNASPTQVRASIDADLVSRDAANSRASSTVVRSSCVQLFRVISLMLPILLFLLFPIILCAVSPTYNSGSIDSPM